MSERVKTLLWTLVLIAGIGASVLQLGDDQHHRPIGGHSHGHDHGSAHQPRKLFSWEPEQAHHLVLVSLEGARLEFRREGDAWAAETTRGAAAAQAFDPQGYLNLFSQARSDREIPMDATVLESYGLKSPVLRVRVEDDAGQALAEVEVGQRTPDGFGRYVFLPSAQTLHIVPNYQFSKALEALGQ